MNKSELVSAVAERADIPKTQAQKTIDALLDTIQTTLQDGDAVRLVGFGTFSVADRAATTGRNPRTGEKIDIPARKQPKFSAGKGLKEAVNEG